MMYISLLIFFDLTYVRFLVVTLTILIKSFSSKIKSIHHFLLLPKVPELCTHAWLQQDYSTSIYKHLTNQEST